MSTNSCWKEIAFCTTVQCNNAHKFKQANKSKPDFCCWGPSWGHACRRTSEAASSCPYCSATILLLLSMRPRAHVNRSLFDFAAADNVQWEGLTGKSTRSNASSSILTGSCPTAPGLLNFFVHLINLPELRLMCSQGKLKQNPTTGRSCPWPLHRWPHEVTTLWRH